MDDEIRNLMDEEIKAQIEGLNALAQGSKEHSLAVEDLARLYKLRTDEYDSELDYWKKNEEREAEEKFREQQSKEQNIDRIIRIGATAAELILPLMFYASWMDKGFKFEETGTFTSTTFKGLFNRFRPTIRK